MQTCRASPRKARSSRLFAETDPFSGLPVPKADKKPLSGSTLNGGLHYNGVLSISPRARHNEELLDHIEEYHSYYAGDKIGRIYLKPVFEPHCLMDYVLKTVARGRADYGRGIFLPKSIDEMRPARPLD